jgi:hypothetical protein
MAPTSGKSLLVGAKRREAPALGNAQEQGGGIVRLYDRETDESAKAFEAWTVYRDLGAERSLQKASEMYYGHGANVGQFERWSRRFGWVERARAFDVEREMVRRSAIEDHLKTQAEDHAAREARIRERILEIREQAAEQALEMLKYPLAEQHIVREDEEGNEVTYVIRPSRWNKATAVQLARLAASNEQTGAGRPIEDEEGEYDLSALTEEEVLTFLSIDEKIRTRGKKAPELQSYDKHSLVTEYGHKSPYLSQKTESINAT